jgi:NADH-quinone oxidoreductase subunit H
MATVSALATTLFLGGWHAPFWIDEFWAGANEGYWPVLWFFGKVLGFVFVFIWLRGSLPRLRYDQFMAFGWKRLIPLALVWTIAVACMRLARNEGWLDQETLQEPRTLAVLVGIMLLLLAATFLLPEKKDDSSTAEPASDREGGFPVPPMPAGGAVRGAAAPLVFPTSGPVTTTAEEATHG